jgi:uncharacterized spore protein YtfJ
MLLKTSVNMGSAAPEIIEQIAAMTSKNKKSKGAANLKSVK